MFPRNYLPHQVWKELSILTGKTAVYLNSTTLKLLHTDSLIIIPLHPLLKVFLTKFKQLLRYNKDSTLAVDSVIIISIPKPNANKLRPVSLTLFLRKVPERNILNIIRFIVDCVVNFMNLCLVKL